MIRPQMTALDVALRSPVWILVGMTVSRPALLELAGGVLALTDEEGRVFEVPVSAVTSVTFPWYYFGGGVKLTVGGTRHRIS